jgi:hypothetical protein
MIQEHYQRTISQHAVVLYRPTDRRSTDMRIGVFSTFMSPNATPQMIRDFGHRV